MSETVKAAVRPAPRGVAITSEPQTAIDRIEMVGINQILVGSSKRRLFFRQPSSPFAGLDGFFIPCARTVKTAGRVVRTEARHARQTKQDES